MIGRVERRDAAARGGRAVPERARADSRRACTGTSPACTRTSSTDSARRVARARHRERRHRLVGRRLRPAARRSAARRAVPLPRRAQRRRASTAVHARRAVRRALSPQRPAVPAVQHALPARGRTAADCLDWPTSRSSSPTSSRSCSPGARVAERTNASTTGLRRRRATGEWDLELVGRLGIRGIPLPSLVDPGARLGSLRRRRARRGRRRRVEVIAVGSHDTASAIVAVPLSIPPNAAYISCGTWGLVGVELDAPVVSDEAREANFTNEGGVDGRVRFLHNVTGLWLLSESVRAWERESASASTCRRSSRGGRSSASAVAAVRRRTIPRFLAPGDMPARIAACCREHGLAVPTTRAAFARTIVESIAEAFAGAVRTAGRLADRDIESSTSSAAARSTACSAGDRGPVGHSRAGGSGRGDRDRQRAGAGARARLVRSGCLARDAARRRRRGVPAGAVRADLGLEPRGAWRPAHYRPLPLGGLTWAHG